jgi:hypothetical protein
VGYSLPCVLESLSLTHQCHHPPLLPLTCECSPSLPLTKRSVGSQPIPYRSQLEPPTQPISFNNFASEVNGLIHFYGERNDYISPIDLWMEEICGSVAQRWHDLGLVLHEYNISMIPNPTVSEVPPCTHMTFNVSLFWFITKHNGKPQVDEFFKWLHWIYGFT